MRLALTTEMIIPMAIATAKAVRTPDVGHAPSHRVDNQNGQVAYSSDF